MLQQIVATRFDGPVKTGRTKPCIFTCENDDGDIIEAITKFSNGCDLKVGALGIETLAAVLAVDLNLPIPEPFIVELSPALIETIQDPAVKNLASASCHLTFGSRKLPNGFSVWPPSKEIPSNFLLQAAEIFAFDELILNADRQPQNPNCLFDGNSYAIFDHEACFMKYIGFQPPWIPGALEGRVTHQTPHLFLNQLKGKKVDLAPFGEKLAALTDARLDEYANCLPPEWVAGQNCITETLTYIKELRDNANSAISEVMRALK